MTASQSQRDRSSRDAEDGDPAASLQRLVEFAGTSAAFWTELLQSGGKYLGANAAVLLRRADSSGWERLSRWGQAPTDGARQDSAWDHSAVQWAEAARTEGTHHEPSVCSARGKRWDGIALDLGVGGPAEQAVACFLVPAALVRAARAKAPALTALARCFELRHTLATEHHRVQRFAVVLDLLTILGHHSRFLATGMAVCNELATRLSCDRVSLGWRRGDYVRLKALSHTERFDRRMDAVRRLERVMEEALDQGEEILWPASEHSTAISRDHEVFSREAGVECICSVPLKVDDRGVGVVCCERNGSPFSEQEVDMLRLLADQTVGRLDALRRQDRWPPVRWACALGDAGKSLLGPRHTVAKLVGVLVSIAVLVLCLGQGDHKVEAPFVLRPELAVHLPSPFDGFIATVHASEGDTVAKGTVLLELDVRELLLEQSSATAQHRQYLREVEKSRAAGALADQGIAEAKAEQASIRLQQIGRYLSQALITAPFDGIVVEGDHRERLGAPLQKGAPLFQMARLDRLYLESSVDERDIHYVAEGMAGRFAFTSRPGLHFPAVVGRIEPAAMVEAGTNTFSVICEAAGDDAAWWRPGMSGVVRLRVGRRRLIWIYTHRTLDFLRMRWWW